MTKLNIGPQANPEKVYTVERREDGRWVKVSEGTLPCGLEKGRQIMQGMLASTSKAHRLRDGDIIWIEASPIYRHPAWSK